MFPRRHTAAFRVLADSFRKRFSGAFANSSRCLHVIIRFVFCFNFAGVVNASAFRRTQTSISPLSIRRASRFDFRAAKRGSPENQNRCEVASASLVGMHLSIKIGTCQPGCSRCRRLENASAPFTTTPPPPSPFLSFDSFPSPSLSAFFFYLLFI